MLLQTAINVIILNIFRSGNILHVKSEHVVSSLFMNEFALFLVHDGKSIQKAVVNSNFSLSYQPEKEKKNVI